MFLAPPPNRIPMSKVPPKPTPRRDSLPHTVVRALTPRLSSSIENFVVIDLEAENGATRVLSEKQLDSWICSPGYFPAHPDAVRLWEDNSKFYLVPAVAMRAFIEARRALREYLAAVTEPLEPLQEAPA
jgi:hypothetical protein